MSVSLRLKAICGVPVSSENQILRLTYTRIQTRRPAVLGRDARWLNIRIGGASADGGDNVMGFRGTPPPTPLGGVDKKSASGEPEPPKGAFREIFFVAI